MYLYSLFSLYMIIKCINDGMETKEFCTLFLACTLFINNNTIGRFDWLVLKPLPSKEYSVSVCCGTVKVGFKHLIVNLKMAH